jgi:penicillin-binding protein 1A
MFKRGWQIALVAFLSLILVTGAIAGLASALIYPQLPSLDVLTDYRPKIPLRVLSEEGAVLGEFGEERRDLVRLADAPLSLRQAILAAEDERFYQHGGVDSLGIVRAAVSNVLSGGAKEGASTITMQVARNFFLTSEKTFRRKINEALLAIKIEHSLSKDQILELYINQIYLGQRAYGFASAAQIYFGKPLQQINLAEAAMLAGLPKAPSAYNPVVNPSRARARQHYVLKRMLDLGYIGKADYAKAKQQRLAVRYNSSSFPASSGHLAEMARQYMFQKYGEAIYTSGMTVHTTVRVAEQRAAEDAVRQGVVDFNRRRGYVGPEATLDLPGDPEARAAAIDEALRKREEVNGLLPAVVLALGKERIRVALRSGDEADLPASELKFAQGSIGPKVPAAKRLKPGSIVRVWRPAQGKPWQLTYLPQVEAALVALSPESGAIRALVGGFDFGRNQFNHVTQAWRQPGSSFKPFVYSAGLERGLTPATVFEDAPISIDPFETGGELWEPKNFDGTQDGPTTVRTALTKSKNLVSIRLLQATGVDFGRAHALRFGFTAERLPSYITLALGAGEVTPLQMATAYAVFASGGLKPRPYFMMRVTDKSGRVLESFSASAPQAVLDRRNAFIMTSMMQDVTRKGTAAAASRLGRGDLAGKTGTTNDHRDAWFSGYNPKRVAVAWVGYDQPRPMGGSETGGVTALPIWMNYMAVALKGVPDVGYAPPEGVISSQIDPATGVPVATGGVTEYFLQEFAPDSGAAFAAETPAPILDKSVPATPAAPALAR